VDHFQIKHNYFADQHQQLSCKSPEYNRKTSSNLCIYIYIYIFYCIHLILTFLNFFRDILFCIVKTMKYRTSNTHFNNISSICREILPISNNSILINAKPGNTVNYDVIGNWVHEFTYEVVQTRMSKYALDYNIIV